MEKVVPVSLSFSSPLLSLSSLPPFLKEVLLVSRTSEERLISFYCAGSVRMDRVAQCSRDGLRIAGKLGGRAKDGGRNVFLYFPLPNTDNRTSTTCLSSADT